MAFIAACHCGAVKLEVARRPRQLTDCNCSICRCYGALWAYYSHRTVKLLTSRASLRMYKWRNGTLEFYHCASCGCVTHHERARKRADGTVAVNARMLPAEVTAGLRVRRLDGADTWEYMDEYVWT